MIAELGLGLSLVFAGLWSGLLLTVTTILHPIYAARDGRGFARDLGRFLPIARTSPTNYACVVGLVLAPATALVGLRHDPTSAPFLLTAAGLLLALVGPVFLSRYLAEPTYAVILGWDPESPPPDWTSVRRRYFAHNWIRGAFTWAAFALLLVAAALHFSSP